MLATSGQVVETMDVWDEIYLPLILLTRKANDVPFVLQARIAQPELDLITCYEELPATLQIYENAGVAETLRNFHKRSNYSS